MTLKHPRRPRLGRQIHPSRVFVSSREAPPVPSTLDLEERVGACLHGGASHDAHSSPVVLSVALRAGIVVGEPPAHLHLPEGSGQPSASGAVTHLHPAFVSPGVDRTHPGHEVTPSALSLVRGERADVLSGCHRLGCVAVFVLIRSSTHLSARSRLDECAAKTNRCARRAVEKLFPLEPPRAGPWVSLHLYVSIRNEKILRLMRTMTASTTATCSSAARGSRTQTAARGRPRARAPSHRFPPPSGSVHPPTACPPP